MSDNLPRMDYRQHRRARRLVHECCNYDEGNCLLLDDGEPCVCVQSIFRSCVGRGRAERLSYARLGVFADGVREQRL